MKVKTELSQLNFKRKNFLLSLWSVPGIGLQSFSRINFLIKKFQIKDEDFWQNKYAIWEKSLLNKRQIESVKLFKKEHDLSSYYSQVQDRGLRVIFKEENCFPKLLKEIDSCPPLLFLKSRLSDFALNQAFNNLPIAVVGTRKMTSYGRWLIKEIVKDLANLGCNIVSGFMYGVDLAAQTVAVAEGGQTIAVLGYGLDHCFPDRQRGEMQAFLEQGAIFLSEYPPTTMAKAGNFVQRNRLIAGLSLATLVIEAGERSGSHITANYANDFGRLVFAIPGPITNPYCEGTKFLIKNGAIPVSSARELLEELRGDYQFKNQQVKLDSSLQDFSKKNQVNSSKEGIVNYLLEHGSLSFDQLLVLTNWSTTKLSSNLFELEIAGKIKQKAGLYCLEN